MENDICIHIDLHNLEDSKFEGSKYVLTSPRSLEACSRLNVKPIELLYKPLSEFQEELLPQDIPLRTIYSLYDESEVIRQQKLKLCRQERNRIIANDTSKTQVTSEYDGQANNMQAKEKGLKKPKKKIRITPTTPVGFKGKSKFAKRFSDKESLKLHRELISKKDKNPVHSRSISKPCSYQVKKRKPQRMSSSVNFGTKLDVRTSSSPKGTAKLPVRDEKILKLMQQRREEEIHEKEVQRQVSFLWEDERKREEALRMIAENKRRQILAEENRIQEEKKARDMERRQDLENEALELKKLSLEDSRYNADLRLMDQLKIQEHRLAERVNKNIARKKNQSQNLQASEKEAELTKQLVLARQMSQTASAAERKDMKLHEESLRKFYENRRERELYEKRQKAVQNYERENSQILKQSIEGRLEKAESNLSLALETRNQLFEKKRREEQLKLRKARIAHKKMEVEMDAWRQGILYHKQMLEEKAADMVDQNIELKSWKAKKERTKRQVEQRKNIAKIHKEVERWRSDLENALQQKEKKVEDLMDEKERSVAQTRAMAQLSQSLRDDIKEKYMSDTFDKKVLEAQLYSNLNSFHRPRTPSLKNKSSVKIC